MQNEATKARIEAIKTRVEELRAKLIKTGKITVAEKHEIAALCEEAARIQGVTLPSKVQAAVRRFANAE